MKIIYIYVSNMSFIHTKPEFTWNFQLKSSNNLQTFIYPVKVFNIKNTLIIMTPEAERFNGWAAMLGFVAAVGAYVTTGQIIPGWF